MIIIIMIIIIMMMMMMIIIIIILFRGAIRDCTISSLRRELFPTRTLKWPGHNREQIMCNTPSACHRQYVCQVVRRDSSAIKFDRVKVSFTLAFYFFWLKPLTNEGGKET